MIGKFTVTSAIARAKELAHKNNCEYVVINDNHYDHDLPAKWIAVSYDAWLYGTDTAPYHVRVTSDGKVERDED